MTAEQHEQLITAMREWQLAIRQLDAMPVFLLALRTAEQAGKMVCISVNGFDPVVLIQLLRKVVEELESTIMVRTLPAGEPPAG